METNKQTIRHTTPGDSRQGDHFLIVVGGHPVTTQPFFQGHGPSLPETNSIFAPKNGWLEYYFPLGEAYFQVRTVSFREGNCPKKVTFSLRIARQMVPSLMLKLVFNPGFWRL